MVFLMYFSVIHVYPLSWYYHGHWTIWNVTKKNHNSRNTLFWVNLEKGVNEVSWKLKHIQVKAQLFFHCKRWLRNSPSVMSSFLHVTFCECLPFSMSFSMKYFKLTSLKYEKISFCFVILVACFVLSVVYNALIVIFAYFMKLWRALHNHIILRTSLSNTNLAPGIHVQSATHFCHFSPIPMYRCCKQSRILDKSNYNYVSASRLRTSAGAPTLSRFVV